MSTVEFDTFQFEKLYGRYAFLKEMPLDAHYHFAKDHNRVRNAVSLINIACAANGSTKHFACHIVGEKDPKGPGIRVLRDDKPLRRYSPRAPK